jgi:hypothetical protein
MLQPARDRVRVLIVEDEVLLALHAEELDAG